MKMTFLFSALFLSLLLLSADLFAGDKHFGARAGWQISTLDYDGDKTDPISSFYLGVYRETQIVPLLRYSLGIEYMQAGGMLDYVPDQKKYKIGYIGVPVNLKAKVGPIFAIAGSGINFKISETDLGEDTKAIDIPAFAGLGFNILIFNIEARYHWGLLEIQEKTKNNYLQIGLGVNF